MCIKNLKGIALTAFAMTVIAQILHTVEAILTMDYYLNPAYLQVWSKIMMPKAGPPPTEFYYFSIAFAFVTWFLFAFAYSKLNSAIKEKSDLKKGLKFGSIIFLVAGIPMSLTFYLLINLPSIILASWLVSSFLLYLVGGIVAAKLVRE